MLDGVNNTSGSTRGSRPTPLPQGGPPGEKSPARGRSVAAARLPGPRTWPGRGRGRGQHPRRPARRSPGPRTCRIAARGRPPWNREAFTRGNTAGHRVSKFSPAKGRPPSPPPAEGGGWPPQPGATEASSARPVTRHSLPPNREGSPAPSPYGGNPRPPFKVQAAA